MVPLKVSSQEHEKAIGRKYFLLICFCTYQQHLRHFKAFARVTSDSLHRSTDSFHEVFGCGDIESILKILRRDSWKTNFMGHSRSRTRTVLGSYCRPIPRSIVVAEDHLRGQPLRGELAHTSYCRALGPTQDLLVVEFDPIVTCRIPLSQLQGYLAHTLFLLSPPVVSETRCLWPGLANWEFEEVRGKHMPSPQTTDNVR